MSDLGLLMVHADDHQPVLDEVEQTPEGEAADDAMPEHLWDEGGDPNDLHAQRWGVIAPQGPRGDRLLALVEPLIRHRREQQGGEPVRVYRVPPVMSQLEAAAWKKEVFRPDQDLDLELPRYQLVLGDLHEVPLAVQQIQGTDGYVGRLAFDDDAGYEAYVDKVLRWEGKGSAHREGRALFYTVHDRTNATRVGYDALVRPGLEAARKRHERGQLRADALVDAGHPRRPDPDELLRAARLDRPGVLFSLSHGEGPPRSGWPSDEHQRRGQGAMSFGRGGRLRGEDLASVSFMPGGLWFMFACFGAGSPQASAFHRWLSELRDHGRYRGDPAAVLDGIPSERPFVAELPRRVLANPQGPLGFIGHVDLAWTYAFRALDGTATSRPAKMMGVVRSLLARNRLGIGFRELYRFLEQTNTELTALDRQTQGASLDAELAVRRGHLWMLREDLAAYVLLGDPAARLPLADGDAARPSPPAAPAVTAQVASSEPIELPLPIDELEIAIGRVLVGDDSLRTIAEEHGLERAQLRELAERYGAGGRAALGVEDD